MNYLIALAAITSPAWMMWLFIKLDNYLEKRKEQHDNAQKSVRS